MSTRMTIDKLVDAIRTTDLDEQVIDWPRQRWEKLWADDPTMPCKDVLSDADEEFEAHGTIRRSWLRGLAADEPMRLLIGAMFWGFGSFNRGPRSVKAMLTQQRTDQSVADVVASIVRESKRGAEAGFASLFDSKGRTRVSHLGVAFGTKLVHFAGYEAPARPRPLISSPPGPHRPGSVRRDATRAGSRGSGPLRRHTVRPGGGMTPAGALGT